MRQEIKGFIDAELKRAKPLSYTEIVKAIAHKYGQRVSKSAISRRVAALELKPSRGRRRIAPIGKRPPRSIFLDCAGAFFLKGAELEIGLLAAINQLLNTDTESTRARKALNLARQINAFLLYAPIFGLNTASDIAGYSQRGLLCLTEQATLPRQKEITQYLDYLTDQKLLPIIIKEVTRIYTDALFINIAFSGQSFYIDGQCRTVWPNAEIPRYFSTTLNKTTSYIQDIFQSPSPQRPLILQGLPGYTFLPPEAFHFIQCFEQAAVEPITRISIGGKSGETLSLWQGLQPKKKCFFIAPLSPWHYERLQGSQIIQGFRQYSIGPTKEPMAVADARINLFNSQLSKNIKVRAALVRRKEERLALITNISQQEERYIKKIVEQYFCRWPQPTIKTYYDLLEEAHAEALVRSQGQQDLTSLSTDSYSRNPQDTFRLLLQQLHRYALSHFFPSEYEPESLPSIGEKFYQQPGFLKKKQGCWEISLQPFKQDKLQKHARIACQKFNQSDIRLASQKALWICLL